MRYLTGLAVAGIALASAASTANAITLPAGEVELATNLVDLTGTNDGIENGDELQVSLTNLTGGGFGTGTGSLADIGSFTTFTFIAGQTTMPVPPVTFGASLPDYGPVTFTMTSIRENALDPTGDNNTGYDVRFDFEITDDAMNDTMQTFDPSSASLVIAGFFGIGADSDFTISTLTTPSALIPVPAALPMALLGFAGLGYFGTRRRQGQA